MAATRLYVYPDPATETLYLLLLGDKESQREDIQDCKRFVKQIQADPNCGKGQGDGRKESDRGEESTEGESDEGDG